MSGLRNALKNTAGSGSKNRSNQPFRTPGQRANVQGDRLVLGLFAAAGLAVAAMAFGHSAAHQAEAPGPMAVGAPMRAHIAPQPSRAAPSLAMAPEALCAGARDDPSLIAAAPWQTVSAAPVALLPIHRATPLDFTPMGDTWIDALRYMNAQRARLGLPDVAQQEGLAKTSLAHAFYNTFNGASGHAEDPGRTYFTGATPEDRIRKGFNTRAFNEIAATVPGAFPSSTTAIEGLFDAPFHRSVMLADYLCAGVGVADGSQGGASNLVVDFGGRRRAIRDEELVAYPFPGQTDAKSAWRAVETPNPMGRLPQFVGAVVGYPITLNTAPGGVLSISQFDVRGASGEAVPCEMTDGSVERGQTSVGMCVPYSPLTPGARYTVTVQGVLTRGGVVNRDFALTWSFATARGSSDPAADAPSAAVYNGLARGDGQ